ncbi:hypothetical protein [Hymenobacter swuensis]|uniref:Uncharacterized protein n=1 Tax=Hymenobacter swuensis DY53 TaxID=1227739 RepID=W8F2J7_9BACT|nr:hypothetical protein [Hymenobacter swuensis]AHJ96005.1 hypothetical protein Hsw_0410 [Hymenobacter swuensis DY53]
MLTSRYLLDIFDLAFDEHPAGSLLRQQVTHLTLLRTEHTGMGAFFYMEADRPIPHLAIPGDTAGTSTEMLDEVEICSIELSLLADATIHLQDGLIHHVEIWNKGGADYPHTDPERYELHQTWRGTHAGRTISR